MKAKIEGFIPGSTVPKMLEDRREIKQVTTVDPDLFFTTGDDGITRIARYWENGCWNYAVYQGDWLEHRVFGRNVVNVWYGERNDEAI